MKEDVVDVVIVGAGPAGATIAWSLAETRMKIVCLEQGDWTNPADYPTTRLDFEMRRFADFALSPNSRKLPSHYPINDAASPIHVSNYNAVGGSSILYAAHYPRFHPSDFRVRSLDGVGEDWPIDYATLAKYYAQNDAIMGVAGLAGDPAGPRRTCHPSAARRAGAVGTPGIPADLGRDRVPFPGCLRSRRPHRGRRPAVSRSPGGHHGSPSVERLQPPQRGDEVPHDLLRHLHAHDGLDRDVRDERAPGAHFPGGEHLQFWWILGIIATMSGLLIWFFRRSRWL